MTTERNHGGAAFPALARWSDDELRYLGEGMSLRDYFAAKAMQGVLAACGSSKGVVTYDTNMVAGSAYEMADAMLKAREA